MTVNARAASLARQIMNGMTIGLLTACLALGQAQTNPLYVKVEGQPLGANAARVIKALDFLGAPLGAKEVKALKAAIGKRDAAAIQTILDAHVLVAVSVNPELRVKVQRGPANAVLRQGGFTPFLVKVLNDATVARPVRVGSPQAGPVYSGAALVILRRQAQTELKDNENTKGDKGRFLSVEMFGKPPMQSNLSGLEAEYAIVLIYSHEAGKREATLQFDIGQGTQDLGFRAEVPVLFNVLPARAVKLDVRDADGQPTTARLEFRDAAGRVYPPQAKRLAPDFFFQPHIYRADGGVVLLPPGKFTMESSRGPEYRVRTRTVTVPAKGAAEIKVRLERWVNPVRFGFYSGDHHIHGAGCSHYDSPTQGVRPGDMFAQVKGEGLNVGCVLTWGPCFDFQRDYFSPLADGVSEPILVRAFDYWRNVDKDIGDRIEKATRDLVGGKSKAPGMASAESIKGYAGVPATSDLAKGEGDKNAAKNLRELAPAK